MNLFDSDNYPTQEPTELTIGDRWTWKRTDLGTDYPPASYALSYAFRRETDGVASIDITASESGSDYIVEVGQATTAAFTEGRWHYQVYITRSSDSERVTIGDGWVIVYPDRASQTTDPVTHAKKMLNAIRATLEKKATKDQLSYTISTGDGSRSISRLTWQELLGAEQYYKRLVDSEETAERIAKGLGSGKKIYARFS